MSANTAQTASITTSAARVTNSSRPRTSLASNDETFLFGGRYFWESESASSTELSKKEVECILELRSNDPAVGYNQWPKHKPPGSAGV